MNNDTKHCERIRRADEAGRLIGMVPELERRLDGLEGRVRRLENGGEKQTTYHPPVSTEDAIDLVRHCVEFTTGKTGYGLDDHFYRDIGFDSLDAVEFVMAIEEETGTDVRTNLAEMWLTPAHAVSYVAGVMQP